MQSDYGYELTDRAEKDIDEIAGYIRDELSNASAAMNFLNRCGTMHPEIV